MIKSSQINKETDKPFEKTTFKIYGGSLMFKLPNGTIVSGEGYTKINEIQYPLNKMSSQELADIGVEVYYPPMTSNIDQRFYYISQQGDPIPKDIEKIKNILKAEVASERWNMEMGGFIFNNLPIYTDEHTRTILNGMYYKAINDPNFYITKYKVNGTYISIPNSLIKVIGDTVTAFIQNCFDQNAAIDEQIDLITNISEAEAFTWSWTYPEGLLKIPDQFTSISTSEQLPKINDTKL